jgi:lipoate-protein ligase A
VVTDPALPGPVNMARDHGLALSLLPGTGVLRLYRWDPPTVSFGRNEPSRGIYSEERGLVEGVAFVRRPTGGRAVLHHQELTYALAFPLKAFGGLRKAYRLINQGLLAGLVKLGAQVQLAASNGPSLPPDAGPCFRQPAEGEVMALGRKLIGSAQVRIGDGVLQHGSIILDGDQDVLRRLRGDDEPVPPPATIRSVLGDVPDLQDLGSSITEGLAQTLGGSWAKDDYREDEKMAAAELEAHYGDSGWTWRF